MANQYDDTQLQKLFTEMDVKHRKRALKVLSGERRTK